jgi:periplasmic protein CpxP/Spy
MLTFHQGRRQGFALNKTLNGPETAFTHLYATRTWSLPGQRTIKPSNQEEPTMAFARTRTLMTLRTARWIAGTVMVTGGMLAALSGANAWAERGHAAHAGKSGTEACPHRVSHHGGMHGAMMPGGRMLNRMLDDIKATDAQRAQIKAIQEAAQADLKKLHAEHANARQDAMQLLAAPVVDATALEKQRQAMLQHHDAVSKRMMTAMLDTSKVLTPEQRSALATQWQERAKARQERRDHHHGGPKG